MRKRRLTVNMALALGAFVISLLMVEAILRLSGFSFELYPEKVEFIGLGDLSKVEKRTKGSVLVDPQVFWVPRRYHEMLANARRRPPWLVTAGDSCVAEGHIAEHIALIAKKSGKPQLSTLNVGVFGWSTYQGLQQLKRDIIPIKPDVVLFEFGWNDHWNGVGLEDQELARYTTSRLYRLRGLRIVQLLQKAFVGVARKSPVRRVPPDRFESNLSGLVDLSREAGMTPVLVTAPSNHHRGQQLDYLVRIGFLTSGEPLIPLHQHYVSIVREVAVKENAALCDLAASVDRLNDNERAKLFRSDGIHFTDAGSLFMSSKIWQCLADNGLLTRRDQP